MNKIQRKRLLNVARALRESPKPEDFTMVGYANLCGTPACALGHYAARTDLQKVFRLVVSVYVANYDGNRYTNPPLRLRARPRVRDAIGYAHTEVLEHFGINVPAAEELFGSRGCNRAQTAIEAAEYIERFVAERS